MKYLTITMLSLVTSAAVVAAVMLAATAAASTKWDRRTVLCWAGVILSGTVFLTATFALVDVTA